MFEHLKDKPKILVTGPQRSGTRICAMMIAKDLGYRYIDETEIQYANVEKVKDLMKHETNFVIQAPALTDALDEVKDLFIVYMIRDLKDINESRRMVKLSNYRPPLRPFIPGQELPEQKYEKWNLEKSKYQYLEQRYEDLKAHPMWVEERKNWIWNQTRDKQFSETEKRIIHQI